MSIRSFYLKEIGTVRECLGCRALIAGGPTRCVRCAVEGDPIARAWVYLRNLDPGLVFITHDGALAVKSEYFYQDGTCQCVLLSSGEYAHFVEGDDTLVTALEVQS